MEKFMPYIWIIILLLSVIAETLSHKLIVIWLAPASAIALALGWLGLDVWVQALVFFAVSTLLITVSALIRRSRHGKDGALGGPDATIGKKARVTERIDNLAATGAVRLGGVVWTARSLDGEPIEAGEYVLFEKIEGNKALVKRKGE